MWLQKLGNRRRVQYRALSTTADRHAKLAQVSSPIRTSDPERRNLIDDILRVDHAGEYGAVRIYQGQLAVLGRDTKDKELLKVRIVRVSPS